MYTCDIFKEFTESWWKIYLTFKYGIEKTMKPKRKLTNIFKKSNTICFRSKWMKITVKNLKYQMINWHFQTIIFNYVKIIHFVHICFIIKIINRATKNINLFNDN